MFEYNFNVTIPAATKNADGSISPGIVDMSAELLAAYKKQGVTLDPTKMRVVLDRPGQMIRGGGKANDDPPVFNSRLGISTDLIAGWRKVAPWATTVQIEHDLVVSRALIELFADQDLAKSVALRGGVALTKLYNHPTHMRYSDDIDLVLLGIANIEDVMTRIRQRLDPWLGTPIRPHSNSKIKHLKYPLGGKENLKIDIDTSEHSPVLGLHQESVTLNGGGWFSGTAVITSYKLEELLATKLRALYTRTKECDLFDLAVACSCRANQQAVAKCFLAVKDAQSKPTRAKFKRKVRARLKPGSSRDSTRLYLPPAGTAGFFVVKHAGVSYYIGPEGLRFPVLFNPHEATEAIIKGLIALLPRSL